MRIVVINTRDIKGGAAIAPYRLIKEMEKKYDVESFFLVKIKDSNDPNVIKILENKLIIFIERVIGKVFNLLGLQYLFFPFYSFQLRKKIKLLKPDLIFLQNIHGGFFEIGLLKKLSKDAPIVWTLHDMWAFTRNAAHTFGNENWKKLRPIPNEKKMYPAIGFDTGDFLLKNKKKIYQNSNIHIIGPSTWICDLAKQSPLFREKNIHYLSHGIDTNIFKERDRKRLKEKYKIENNYRTIIFVAEVIEKNPYKGGDLLLKILRQFNEKSEKPVNVIVIGKGELPELEKMNKLEIIKPGYINDERVLSEYFSLADLFVYPTKAEIFGLVLLESIASGTPAITFNVGGCKDIIVDNETGILIDPFDVDKFVEKMIKILNDTLELNKLSQNGLLLTSKQFKIEHVSLKTFQLFQKIVGN